MFVFRYSNAFRFALEKHGVNVLVSSFNKYVDVYLANSVFVLLSLCIIVA